MTHPDVLRLAALCDGEARENEARELEEHLLGCETCRAEHERLVFAKSALVSLPLPPASSGFAARVLERKTLPRWPVFVALAAAASLLFVLDDGALMPRGGASADQGLRVFAAAAPGETAIEARDADAHSVFSFSVFRGARTPTHTMLFAIDAAGEVHWFYPAYNDTATSPSSVQLRHEGWSLLPHAMRMAAAAKGPARFFLLTSEQPLDVPAIEARVRGGQLDPPSGARITRVDIDLH